MKNKIQKLIGVKGWALNGSCLGYLIYLGNKRIVLKQLPLTWEIRSPNRNQLVEEPCFSTLHQL